MKLTLIAAVARNGVVGDGTKMPWHLPEDLARFRALTMGHPVIMGRRTWDSLPARFRPLPGRRNIVVTRQTGWHAEGAESAASPDAALALVADADQAFVIGGTELWAAALPHADELQITEIDADFEGSVCFPPHGEGWVEVAREAHVAAPPNRFPFAFVTWRRRRT